MNTRFTILRVLFAAVLFCLTIPGIYAQSGFSIAVNKVLYEYYSPPSPVGLFTVSYTPGSGAAYLSIGAQNNSNGMFDIIISNMYLPSSADGKTSPTLSTFFDFSAISPPPYTTGFSLTLYVHVLSSPGFYPFDPSTWFDTKTVTVSEFTYDPAGVVVVENPPIVIQSVTKPNHTVGDPQSEYRYRGDAPNLDLNDSMHPDTLSFAGDLNACVPTATANSMKWMESTYTDINLPEDMTLRKTMETLSGLMHREKNEGTTTPNMVKGKLDFMEEYNLPVEVKFQAFYVDGNIGSTSGNSLGRNFNNPANKRPTWDFIKKMMKDGEDVEMNFTWVDTSNNKWYAHSVNVTGINEFESGVKKIAFKHDARQRAEGGLLEEIQQVTVDADGWMRFGEHNENFIRDVVVESPVVPEGKETAAWLNELFTSGGNLKTNTPAVDEFAEIVANEGVTNLEDYRITIYNGSGEVETEITLDQFTAGEDADSFIVYSYSFTSNVIPDDNGAVGIAYSGSPIPSAFISWGGEVTAIEGDWTGLTSTDIGFMPTPGNSIALSGAGTEGQSFSWVSMSDPSPGDLNPTQTIPVELMSFTALAEKDGVMLKWNTASELNNAGFEVERTSGKNSKDWKTITFVAGSGTSSERKEYSYLDKNITAGTYSYRLKQKDYDGSFKYSDAAEVSFNVPGEFSLKQNYPNPFNPSTVIEYAIPEQSIVVLKVFDILGSEVKTLVNESKSAGVYKIEFNAEGLSNGVYIYRLQAGDFTASKTFMLMK